MDIISHSWNEKMIDQLSGDTIIGGHTIPKGYCNATQLCKANGKIFGNYIRLKRSKAYLKALSAKTGIKISDLVIEIKGAPDGDPSLQGTWVHQKVAINIARIRGVGERSAAGNYQWRFCATDSGSGKATSKIAGTAPQDTW